MHMAYMTVIRIIVMTKSYVGTEADMV